ncbi:hypothetical protein GCL60_16425 [Silvanigrella paludirubra]|uniref:Helix-turn-helix domain-containing protein n=1 Tax=Silvanigrella paludirubra TaxID=2499159 RepID=A0A6N6VN41_9BACT|nr:helix-turn-helix domain-containing protein [Silvanigrella paludirubra]KAB8035814.1 hypothetical protein GCL60_16425 [Silvanigrella paludirubra]
MKKIIPSVKNSNKSKQIKNPKGAGRKKLFQDKYHNEIIDSMKKGQSLSFFASKIGVSKQTVYNWINEIQNFKESFEIAQTACQAFWETLALNNAVTAKGNGNQIQYQMSKRFRDDYGDSSQINIFNSNNQNNTKAIEEMTREELDIYYEKLLKEHQKAEKNDK